MESFQWRLDLYLPDMPIASPKVKSRCVRLWICLALAAATAAVYWPVSRFEFVNLDDPDYVTANPFVTQGLTWSGFLWAFQTSHAANWHPLTWLSHMLDVQFFGLEAGWHHLVNLLFHIANTLLLYLVLRRMTGTLWRSALVAALFALHPLHVESVAWVAERKDVLSTFFGLLSIGAYVRWTGKSGALGPRAVPACPPPKPQSAQEPQNRKPKAQHLKPSVHRPRRGFGRPVLRLSASIFYLLSLLLFALSLMSKPMLVTLPFLLLLLDYWPLQRWEPKTGAPRLKTLLLLVREKAPYLVLAAVSSVITLIAQGQGGTVASFENTSMIERFAGASLAYVTYLGKTVWPHSLAMFHPFVRDWSTAPVLSASFFLLAMSVAAVLSARRQPWCAVGWFWFLGALVPVIGFVQVGAQAVADRYTYIPLVGIFIALAWALPELLSRWRYRQIALGALAAASLLACMAVTSLQLPHWKNTHALCGHALRVTTGNYLAHFVLGSALLQEGRFAEAKAEFTLALQISPGFSPALAGLGKVLLRDGKDTQAAAWFYQTLDLFPQHAVAHYLLAGLLVRQGKLDEATHHFDAALRSNPALFEARVGLAQLLVARGKHEEAEGHLREALQAKPGNIEGHRLLAEVYSAQKRGRELRDEYAQMVRLAPDWPEAFNNLAWLLATHPTAELRNGTEAVRLAERACQLTGGTNFWMLSTLAAAYAEAGQYPEAVKTQQRVCDLAAAQGQAPPERLQRRLELYRSGQPYHEP